MCGGWDSAVLSTTKGCSVRATQGWISRSLEVVHLSFSQLTEFTILDVIKLENLLIQQNPLVNFCTALYIHGAPLYCDLNFASI